ncbi:kinase-like protein [Rickenella mellea]|uniref:Kinase-like protein n=1 Tax=Rickenella mellea TaxID=50990 RepID=A0A4Y7PGE5_9AGAM|nr:kinase-like protein [Rickenella mellea]
MCNCHPTFDIPMHDPAVRSRCKTDFSDYDNRGRTNSGVRTDTVFGSVVVTGRESLSDSSIARLNIGTLKQKGVIQNVVVKSLSVMRGMDDGVATRRFWREMVVWTQLCHRNISPLLGTWTNSARYSPTPSLVSPYYRNGTLEAYVKIDPSDLFALHVVRGIQAGVAYLHRRKIIHGDLRPENIMIDDHLEPRILDFGFSKIADVKGFTTASSARISFYTQPEYNTDLERNQAIAEVGRNQIVSRANGSMKGDVWAFAMVVLWAFSKRHPYYPEKNVAQFRSRWKSAPYPPGSTYHQIPPVLWNILLPCWRVAPEDRPNVNELDFSALEREHRRGDFRY